jgi:protein tyrosine/serine phosphatase
VTDGLPTPFQIIEFAHVVEDPDNAPLLIHCASANRVAAMWALYRALKGIPDEIALEEARTIGLRPDLEADVRKRLAERIPTK